MAQLLETQMIENRQNWLRRVAIWCIFSFNNIENQPADPLMNTYSYNFDYKTIAPVTRLTLRLLFCMV